MFPNIPPLTLASALQTFAKRSIYADNPTAHALLVGNGASALATLSPGTARNVPISDGTDWTSRALQAADIPSGLGYVTSVGLSLPSIFNISGSPVTGAGTLTATLVVEPANRVFAGPTTGADAAPTFRALVATDIPASSLSIATTQLTGGLQAAQFPALTGDITTVAGALATTLATVNSNVGSFALSTVTVNAKGLVTAVSAASTTGSGSVVLATSPTITTPTIAKLANLTSNGFVKTSGGDGTLSVDTGSYQPLDPTLTAWAAFNTNGLLTQTAADTFTGRTLTGTTNRISVTNGDGVSGNPTLDIGTDVVTLTGSQTLTNKSIVATQLTGTLQAGQFPVLTGDLTTAGGALATTLATVNSNVGSFAIATVTVNGKGLVTAASAAATTGSGSVVLASAPVVANATLTTATLRVSDAATNTVVNVATLTHQSSATGAAGFGGSIAMRLKSSTANDRDAAKIDWVWNVATDASAVGDLVLYAASNPSNSPTFREGLRIRGAASATQLAFFGATPASQQTMGAATASALYTATEQTMLQKVYDVLRTFGFGT